MPIEPITPSTVAAKKLQVQSNVVKALEERGFTLLQMMVSIAEHTVDGKTDWKAYKAAQTANGERCRECGGFIALGRGYPELCYSCKQLISDDGEVTHNDYIRCPKCGHQQDGYFATEEMSGEDCDVQCAECDYEYQIQRDFSVSYNSPARLTEEERQDDGEDT